MSQCGCESISGYRRRPENDVGASGVLCFVFNRRVVNTAVRARLAANYWRKIDDEEGKPEDAAQNPSGQGRVAQTGLTSWCRHARRITFVRRMEGGEDTAIWDVGCPPCRGYRGVLGWSLMPKNLKRYNGRRDLD